MPCLIASAAKSAQNQTESSFVLVPPPAPVVSTRIWRRCRRASTTTCGSSRATSAPPGAACSRRTSSTIGGLFVQARCQCGQHGSAQVNSRSDRHCHLTLRLPVSVISPLSVSPISAQAAGRGLQRLRRQPGHGRPGHGPHRGRREGLAGALLRRRSRRARPRGLGGVFTRARFLVLVPIIVCCGYGMISPGHPLSFCTFQCGIHSSTRGHFSVPITCLDSALAPPPRGRRSAAAASASSRRSWGRSCCASSPARRW